MARDRLKPLGLITAPGKSDIPAGGLAVAENVLMRTAGKLERVRDLTDEGNIALNSVPAFVLPLPTSTYAAYGGIPARTLWGSTAALFRDVVLKIDLGVPSAPSPVLARDRYFLSTGMHGEVVHDYLSPSTADQREPRAAGFGLPGASVASVADPAGPFTNVNAGWRALIRRVFTDGYSVQSPPSSTYLTSAAGGTNVFTVTVTLPETVTAGDVIEVYRTVTRAAGISPGSQFYFSRSVVLSGADVAAGFVAITDRTADTSLGLDLYTNENEEGEDQSDDQPPQAGTVALYKGYAFYGNIRELPRYVGQIPLRNTSPLSTNDRLGAIGTRNASVTVAVGSAVMTGVSAADLIGLAVGQSVVKVSGFGTLPGAALIASINTGAGTVTLSGVVVGSGGPAVVAITDVVYWRIGGSGGSGSFTLSTTADLASIGGRLSAESDFGFGGSTPSVTLSVSSFLRLDFLGAPLSLSATNGQNWTPALTVPSASNPITADFTNFAGEVTANGVRWSKPQLPEAVPLLQTVQVGNGTLYKMEATRDALWLFCSDGLWKMTGSGGDWRNELVDASLLLAHVRGTCVYRDQVYAYTNRGIVSIDAGAGIKADISDPVIGDVLPPAAGFNSFVSSTSVMMSANEYEDEIWFGAEVALFADPRTFFVFNVLTRAWTTVVFTPPAEGVGCIAYDRQRSYLLFGVNKATVLTVASLRPTSPSTFSKAARVEFQPLYSDNESETKQWISAEYLFDATNDTLVITPTFSGIDNPAATLRSRGAGDSRVSSYVPMAAYALNQSIRVGWKASDTTQRLFFGVLPRFTDGSEQELQR